MGFNPPVPQNDSDWEIRVAVLLSLVFQVVLISAGPLRKRSSASFTRFVIWSSYLLADWVADLALGLLLNNMGNIGGGRGGGGGGVGDMVIPSTAGLRHVPHSDTAASGSIGGGGGGGSPVIFAFWAPFLLLHLGGPDTITAYSLADNELWLRHLIGLLFELSAAAVVFFCSLVDNPMIVATPIMFIAGIIKYGERTYSLYYGSTDGFPIAILGTPEVRSTNLPKLMQAYSSRERAGLLVDLVTVEDSSDAFWASYEGNGEAVHQGDEYNGVNEVRAYDLFVNFRSIFVNGVVSTRNRRRSETFYKGHRDCMKAFDILELELSYTYDMLYTKKPVLSSPAGYVLRFVGCCCVISSLVIFAVHDKSSMRRADVGITYALLATAVALEAAALVRLLFSKWTLVYSQKSKRLSWLASAVQKAKHYWRTHHRTSGREMWSGTVWQMNLVDHSLLACRRDAYQHLVVNRIWFEPVNRIWFKPVLSRITKGQQEYRYLLTFIFGIIKDTVNRKITSKERKKACQARGEEALRKLKACFKTDIISHGIESTVIFQSVSERDFDESLLMWHIATDLCLSTTEIATDLCLPITEITTNRMMVISKCLSEYLLYLLVKKPEMMSATMGIGQLRYENTYEGAKLLFQSSHDMVKDLNHKMACEIVLGMDATTKFENSFVKGDRTKTVLFNAFILAKALKESFTDQGMMWNVVAHVWAEMLTFTAAHTHAREHLRKLSLGGELITMVWFLMAHMGMSSSLFEVQETESLNKLIIYDQ